MATARDRYRGALLGLATGDAVGTTLEFRAPGSFSPITDMAGGGPFGLEAWQWTDDTSMALCLATSLVECGGFDPYDQMDRYCRWWDEGYLSATGACFDIGGTVRSALARYKATRDPISGSADPHHAANGSLMRLAPVVLYYHPDIAAVARYAPESSRTTHAAPEAVDACRILATMLAAALDGLPRQSVLESVTDRSFSDRLCRIVDGEYRGRPAAAIRGTGYVVDCLEAALWAFERTDTFEDAVLAAANLGDDADTTAAVCGQIAGAWYGASGIPQRWLDRLAMYQEIQTLADRLMAGPAGRTDDAR
jgi:ADP-ribosyl-[dinitrogen reductase] hydrolase